MALFPASYTIRRKALAFLGQQFHFRDANNNNLAFIKQKAFKLKEDIRIYADETMSRELLTIRARNIIDFSAAYDVSDPESGRILGTWRRKGFYSLVRDSWELLVNEQPIAQLKEDGLLMAMVRRVLCSLIPQHYDLTTMDGQCLARYAQRINPFVFKIDVENLRPEDDDLGKLVAAGAVLLGAVEGRQQ